MAQKILFIEDQSTLQKIITDTLAKDGYEVVSALDGEAGVELAKKEIPNLILLDLILPKKDGFAVLEVLKKNSITASIPVVVLTNLEGSDEIARALSLGAAIYLVKINYTPKEIAEKIKEVLGQIK